MKDIKISPVLFFGVLFFVLGFPLFMLFGTKLLGTASLGTFTIICSLIALSIGIYLRLLAKKGSETNKFYSLPFGLAKVTGNYFSSSEHSLKRKIALFLFAVLILIGTLLLFAWLFATQSSNY